MTTYQISRVQHRRGTSGELPNALADGEIGITTDTGEMFFGAPDHPSVSSRNSYPYQNIKVITEFDIQRSLTGDVYYHGPLISKVCGTSGNLVPVLPLFPHNQRSFANYDFSLEGTQGSTPVRVMGSLSVCVHPTTTGSSVVKVNQSSICAMNFTGSILDSNFGLSDLDETLANNGVTWLSFKNNFGLSLTLSLSGREWSTPAPPVA